MEIVSVFTSLITLLPEVAVLILCIYYYSRTQAVEGLLMSIGSGGGLLIGAFYRLMPVIDMDFFTELSNQNIFFITGVIGFFTSSCFVVGLGLLIMKKINQK